MIRAGFLSEAERQALVGLARDGLAEHRIARRANAIVLLDTGWSCAKVASALLLDDDTVRGWYRAYESDGLNGLSSFGHEGSACRLAEDQQRALKDWITARLPRSTKVIGAWIEKNFALSYSRPGLIALLHRLGFDYRKPREAPRKLNEAQQKAFIAGYEKLLNTMGMDEAVVFVDAVHPTHQVHASATLRRCTPVTVAVGHSLRIYSASGPPFVRCTPIATFQGVGPKGRDVPSLADISRFIWRHAAWLGF
jgi:transposase